MTEVVVMALHRVLALTPAADATLYTSTGTVEPAYVLFNCTRSSPVVLEVPLVPLLKSWDRTLRKSDEKIPDWPELELTMSL